MPAALRAMSMLDVAGSAGHVWRSGRILDRAYPHSCQLKVLLALANDIIQPLPASWYKAALRSSLSVLIIAAIVCRYVTAFNT
jgi:hypothetical protein